MYADPFDVEAQKKIEAAIRQVGITFLRIANVAYGNISFLSYITGKMTYDGHHYMNIYCVKEAWTYTKK